MNKKELKQLVTISFEKSELVESVITRIGNALTRSELKEYIRMLKLEVGRRTVTVTNALPLNESQRQELESVFGDKRMVYETDKTLILGTRIVNGDIVYNMNLKQQLEDIETHVSN